MGDGDHPKIHIGFVDFHGVADLDRIGEQLLAAEANRARGRGCSRCELEKAWTVYPVHALSTSERPYNRSAFGSCSVFRAAAADETGGTTNFQSRCPLMIAHRAVQRKQDKPRSNACQQN